MREANLEFVVDTIDDEVMEKNEALFDQCHDDCPGKIKDSGTQECLWKCYDQMGYLMFAHKKPGEPVDFGF